MGKQVPLYVKTVIGEAYKMFMTQGITRKAISEELQDLRRRADEAGTFNYNIINTPPKISQDLKEPEAIPEKKGIRYRVKKQAKVTT